jgi:hypothetical protein
MYTKKPINQKSPNYKLRLLADRTGLEPATSAVTGRHSNQLNYRSVFLKQISLFRECKYSVFNLLYNKYFKIIVTRCFTGTKSIIEYFYSSFSTPYSKLRRLLSSSQHSPQIAKRLSDLERHHPLHHLGYIKLNQYDDR